MRKGERGVGGAAGPNGPRVPPSRPAAAGLRRGLGHLLAAVALAFPACTGTGIAVQTERDPSANVAAYTTYAWRDPPPAPPGAGDGAGDAGASLLASARAAVEEELAARGRLRPATGEPASVLVGVRIFSTERTRVPRDPYYAFYEAVSFEEGTLMIEIIDRETAQRVWRGIARGRRPAAPAPEEQRARIRAAVAAILDRFPN